MPLEIAIDTLTDAISAAPSADRLEVCRDLAEQGLTPRPEFLRTLKERLSVPVIALVRPWQSPSLPAGGLEVMLREIEESVAHGADALAIGALTDDGRIDRESCARLVRACAGRPVTFHRLFDFARDPSEALDVLIDLGFARVLTAGVPSFDHSQRAQAERLGAIRRLMDQAAGRIAVVACGGIRSHNVREFLSVTTEIHSACRTTAPDGAAAFDPGEAVRLHGLVPRN